jgi:sulfur-oxidizing protein SoxX
LSKQEIAYGNIGPSLLDWGNARGRTEFNIRYTWAKIWNAHAYNPCSQMPRFGDAGILTEAQVRDVMALLFDAQSPVNAR